MHECVGFYWQTTMTEVSKNRTHCTTLANFGKTFIRVSNNINKNIGSSEKNRVTAKTAAVAHLPDDSAAQEAAPTYTSNFQKS